MVTDPVPRNALLEIGEDEKIPATLKDGEHLELRLQDVLAEFIVGLEDKNLEVTV
jgi:hypothetical protein